MVEPAGDLFESPLIAVATTTLLLFAASVSYLIGHTDWKKWSEKAESKPAVAGAAKLSTATVADQKLAASLVFSDDGNFEPVYDDSLLGKYFAPVKIVEIKERIAGKAREARRQTELERRQLLEPLLVFVDRSLSEFGPLTPLANRTGADPAGIWTSANLSEISTWLGASSRKFAEEKHADRQDHLDALERQLGREKERQNRLRGELRALKSGLSFD
ncbi:MAG: hypothetical protein Q8J74_05280, partial [Candidatus Didemnitutus sp.]|nr:hypothetical protein [Candidatus Didemnitutus sp.]